MSPELERLLTALDERDTCEPENRARCERTMRRLLDDALQRVPHTSRSSSWVRSAIVIGNSCELAANRRRFLRKPERLSSVVTPRREG
jgi:uncharacterized protein (DUF1499 family)